MADFIHDTFTDADGTPLASHVGETGATWSWDSTWGSFDNSFEIRNNQLKLVAGSPTDEHYLPSGLIPDGDWSLEVGFIATGPDFQTIEVLTGSTIYGQEIILIRSESGTSEIQFYGGFDVGFVTFNAPGAMWVFGQEYVARVDVVGNLQSYYVDDVLVSSQTVSAVRAPFLTLNLVRGTDNAQQLGMTYLRAWSAAATGPFWTSYVGATET